MIDEHEHDHATPVMLEPKSADAGSQRTELTPEADARRRATACMAAIQNALREHGCAIRAVIAAEPVGNDGDRALISTRWKVQPLEV